MWKMIWSRIKSWFSKTPEATLDCGDALCLRTVLDSTNSLVIVTDMDGKVLLFNKEAQSTFGYSEEEIKKQGLAALAPGEWEPKLPGSAKFLKYYMQTGRLCEPRQISEVEGFAKDGSPVSLLFSVRVVDFQDRVLLVGTAVKVQHILDYFQQVTTHVRTPKKFSKAIETPLFHENLQDLANVAIFLQGHLEKHLEKHMEEQN
jgi:PAS domain S-box-containing protein